MTEFPVHQKPDECQFSEISTSDFVLWFYGKMMLPYDLVQVMHFWQEYQK